jgi:hypothetical protein
VLATYLGHEALTFPDYLDLETGRTLTAEPGGTYDVAPASGRLVPDLPAQWFTVVFATGGEVAGEDEDDGTAGGEGEPAVPPSDTEDEHDEQ